MLTQQEQTFIDSGADFVYSVLGQIPNEKFQEVKNELIKKLTYVAEQGPADKIETTIGKGLDFADAGIHLSSNAKAITIADAIDMLYKAVTGGKGLFAIIGSLIKANHAIKS